MQLKLPKGKVIYLLGTSVTLKLINMEVQINGTRQDVSSESNVSSLLYHLSISTQGIAVAINGTVIPRGSWDSHSLQSEDKITIIKATQGG